MDSPWPHHRPSKVEEELLRERDANPLLEEPWGGEVGSRAFGQEEAEVWCPTWRERRAARSLELISRPALNHRRLDEANMRLIHARQQHEDPIRCSTDLRGDEVHLARDSF